MIWLALLIPLIAIVILVVFYSKHMNIIEYLVVFLVPIICILIGKGCSVSNQTKDTEYWNSYGINAVYEEAWSESWVELETYTTTDSKGNTEIHTRLVNKTAYHPEQWTLNDNINSSYSISEKYFNELCVKWGNKKFKELNRGSHTSHTITKDGDAYVTDYDNIFDHIVSVCKKHNYENRVQCSGSVFNFQKVSKETMTQYGLFDYPKENKFNFNPIMGYHDICASEKLQRFNALNGKEKQLHMMLLVFMYQPLEAGLFQESYWKGGNKNEFILCVGLSDTNITWTKVISWTENEELKIKTAREIKEMKEFDVVKIVNYMGERIPPMFVRKHFKDFNYITIQPTTTATIITFIITLLVTIGISFMCIYNDDDCFKECF